MKLGIDFGTTRIVAAVSDRGNYPVVSFETPEGTTEEWFPPLFAVNGTARCFGWEAYGRQPDPSWTVVRSVKRLLEDAGPATLLEIDGHLYGLLDLITGLAAALREALCTQSSVRVKDAEPLEIMLGVPANANTNQRFLTAEAFRRAGFVVLGVSNEPSAASVEFGHRNKKDLSDKQLLLVYDLGGGTFDSSLVEHDDRMHHILASEGISTLGGDDFDHVLGELALAAGGLRFDQLSASESFRLWEICRQQKESLHPNTRKMIVDLDVVREGLGEVTILASDYYEAVRPMVEETTRAVHDLLERHGNPEIEWLYVTGGGSELPVIARMLKEDFGRRVKRSAYTRSATAIGLAIQIDEGAGYQLHDRFTRYFGVFREAECGTRIVFDPIFPKGTALPAAGITRTYMPVHNIGHFRYLESSHLTPDLQPAGDITIWDQILFPFDPALKATEELSAIPVGYSMEAAAQVIEELYSCNEGGSVVVTIRNRTSGYERKYPLGRWQVKTKPVAAARKRRTART